MNTSVSNKPIVVLATLLLLAGASACASGSAADEEPAETTATEPADTEPTGDEPTAPSGGSHVEAALERMNSESGSPVDAASCSKVFRECQRRDGGECLYKASCYLLGVGADQDLERADAMISEQCGSTVSDGCLFAAAVAVNASNQPKVRAMGRDWVGAFCEAGSGAACHVQGELHHLGHGVDKDVEQAAASYRKACDLGELEACSDLGLMHIAGQGVDQDRARARELFEDACQKGAGMACRNLALMYARGVGVDKDLDAATRWLAEGCEKGSKQSCKSLEQACRQGHEAACSRLED